MERNFNFCPHCFAKGKERRIQPATPQRTPLVSRSDGSSFHLFLEDSYVRPAPRRPGFEVMALFRYDLDPAGVKAESCLVVIPTQDSKRALALLESAADQVANTLAAGRELGRLYVFQAESSRLSPVKQDKIQMAR